MNEWGAWRGFDVRCLFRWRDPPAMARMVCAIVFAVALSPANAGDCGEFANREAIGKAGALVLSMAPVRSTVGEYPSETGTQECVRFVFSVTPWGRPFHVAISETSGNAAFEMAASDALSGYRFEYQVFGFLKTYTLVFKGSDNKRPDGYFDRGEAAPANVD